MLHIAWQTLCNLRCTDSIRLTEATQDGDQTVDAYSSNGLTYVLNARTRVGVSRETKHLCIKHALELALATIQLMYDLNFSALSIITARSLYSLTPVNYISK
jgi:hypothetical protein